MSLCVWRGGAQGVANVWHATPALVEIGDSFILTINHQSITVTATAATVANVVDLFVVAIAATTIPEWSEVAASAGVDNAGTHTHLVLTGPADGAPITITASTGDIGLLSVSVVTLVNGSAAVNEKQVVALAGGTGGNLTLTFDGQTTAAIAYNANAATADTAMDGLSNIVDTDVVVTGSNPWTFEFANTYAGLDVPLMTGNGANVSGGITATVTTTTQGHGAGVANEVQRITITSTSASMTSYYPAPHAATMFYWYLLPGWTAAQVLASFESGASGFYGVAGSCVVTKQSDTVFDIEFAGAYAGTDVTQTYGTGATVTTEVAGGSGTAVNEVQTISFPTAQGGNWTVTLSGNTSAAIAYNANAATATAAAVAMSTIGTANCAVTTATVGQITSYAFAFQGGLAATNIPAMTCNAAGLTGTQVYVSKIQSAVAAVNEVQVISLLGTPTGGTCTVTCGANTTANTAWDATAATWQTNLQAIASIGANNATVTGAAGGPWLVTFVGALAGTNVGAMTGSGTLLTGGGGTQTLAITEVTMDAGPHHFDTANNWSGAAVPVTTDTITYEYSDVDCLYGLAQSAIVPASITLRNSFTGKLGLPPNNALGYPEYRSQYLAVGTDGNTTIAVDVGGGAGTGSGRVNIDTLNCQATVTVKDTGTAADTGLPALRWKGTHASNIVRVYRGTVGIACMAGEAAVVATLNEGYVDNQNSDASIVCGDDVQIGTLVKDGGYLITGGKSGHAVTAITHRAGEMVFDGTDGATALTVLGGIFHYGSTGTLAGAPVVAGMGVLDFSRDSRVKTVTNPIEVYGNDAAINDPFQAVTGLVADYNQTTRIPGLGENIRVTRGTPA